MQGSCKLLPQVVRTNATSWRHLFLLEEAAVALECPVLLLNSLQVWYQAAQGQGPPQRVLQVQRVCVLLMYRKEGRTAGAAGAGVGGYVQGKDGGMRACLHCAV